MGALSGRAALRASRSLGAGLAAPVDVSLACGAPRPAGTDVYLEFLGTSSAVATATRNVSAALVRFPGGAFMVDCGEGTLRQMLRSTAAPGDLRAVFVTHVHSDHVLGVPGLSTALSGPPNRGVDLPDRRRSGPDLAAQPVLFGPRGLVGGVLAPSSVRSFRHIPIVPPFRGDARNVSAQLGSSTENREQRHNNLARLSSILGGQIDTSGIASKASYATARHATRERARDVSRFAYERIGDTVTALEAATADGGAYDVYRDEQWEVRAAHIRHTAFCVGYVFSERVGRGSFRVDLLSAAGVPPGPLYAELSRGRPITAPDGRVITPQEAMCPPRRGRKIVVLGDTSHPGAVAPLAMDCDVLVHEATCASEDRDLALRTGHSTAAMAGAFARAVRARTLVLTHFSPRYAGRGGDTDDALQVRVLVEQARDAMGGGRVVAARDFMTVLVPEPSADDVGAGIGDEEIASVADPTPCGDATLYDDPLNVVDAELERASGRCASPFVS